MPGYLTISTTSPPDRDLYSVINFWAPRVMQNITGNFTIDTKLVGAFNASIQSGGILVWQDQNNFLRLERACRDGYQEILFIGTINGVFSVLWSSPETSNPGMIIKVSNINTIYLMLTRIGMTYSGYYSTNGLDWDFLANITMETPYSLMGGLYLVNRGPPEFSSTASAVSFDYFRISPAKVLPATIIVPDIYPTIQAAINAASAGDTIYVRNGTYYENVVVNKTISLIGENKNTTVVDRNIGIVLHEKHPMR